MRKNNDQPIAEVIKEIFKRYHLESKVNEVQIKDVWLKVMGKSIAHYTSSIHLKDKKLTIILTSAPLRQDMHYNKELLIQRLNEEMGERVINEIVIK